MKTLSFLAGMATILIINMFYVLPGIEILKDENVKRQAELRIKNLDLRKAVKWEQALEQIMTDKMKDELDMAELIIEQGRE